MLLGCTSKSVWGNILLYYFWCGKITRADCSVIFYYTLCFTHDILVSVVDFSNLHVLWPRKWSNG